MALSYVNYLIATTALFLCHYKMLDGLYLFLKHWITELFDYINR